MKRLISLSLAALVPFGVSAYVSWKWQSREAGSLDAAPAGQDTPAATMARRDSLSTQLPGNSDQEDAAEAAAKLATRLRSKLASVHEKEKQLAARQKQLDLIYHDIRSERVRMEELWTQIRAELQVSEKQSKASSEAPLPAARKTP